MIIRYTPSRKDGHMKKFMCRKCGHEWLPRVKKPAQCPKCKGYLDGKKFIIKSTKRSK